MRPTDWLSEGQRRSRVMRPTVAYEHDVTRNHKMSQCVKCGMLVALYKSCASAKVRCLQCGGQGVRLTVWGPGRGQPIDLPASLVNVREELGVAAAEAAGDKVELTAAVRKLGMAEGAGETRAAAISVAGSALAWVRRLDWVGREAA